MGPGKQTFKLRFERGTDFIRYLRTENIRVDGIDREELKSLYNNNYKTYRQQIYPDEGRVNFSTIMFTLFQTNTLHHKNRKIFNGPLRREGRGGQLRPSSVVPEPHQNDKPRKQLSTSTSTNGPSEQASVSKRRSKRPQMRAIAVDQHMVYKKTSSGIGRAAGEDEAAVPVSSDRGVYECRLCLVTCHSHQEYQMHLRGKRHHLKQVTTGLRKNENYMTQDKDDIKITVAVPGKLQATKADTVVVEVKEDEEVDVIFKVENTSENDDLVFCRAETLKRVRAFQLHDNKKVTDGTRKEQTIPGGGDYTVIVKTKRCQIGMYHSPIAFQFCRPASANTFIYIIRFLILKVTNGIIEELAPTEEYRKPLRVSGRRDDDVEIIEGVKPEKLERNTLERKIPLDMFLVPARVRKIINRGFDEEKATALTEEEMVELKKIRGILEEPLKWDTYAERFAYLLYCEEIQVEVDIRRYDMENVTMTRFNRRCLLLKVPGLAENRPSVLKGDWLYVRIVHNGTPSSKEYKGYVHEVQQNNVALGFHQSLLDQYVTNMKFNVRFNVNRFPGRMQHRAVKLAVELSLRDIILPTVKSACTWGTILPPNEPLRYLYNDKIKTNPEQLKAVTNIVCGTSRPAPYIVFGPPGTGKTVTIVEAMKQIVRCIPTAHILACAPSNSSADVITDRLLEHLPKSLVFRMMASSRPWTAVKETIKDACNYDKVTEQYYYPCKDEIKQYKVVICTLVTAGRIASASFPSEHFTHVFVDEAGCATEPECMIPVAGVLDCLPDVKDGGQLVLAGDPKQLGPTLRSPLALKYGLRISLLERYMTQCDVYSRKTSGDDSSGPAYDARVMTKLVNNYRSHESILKAPNKMFYDGELLNKADPIITGLFCNWSELPKQGFPIIFDGIEGEENREERSPSFFNPMEICLVLNYVKQLLSAPSKGMKVKQSHIGVISPYRKQVQKLQKMFAKMQWHSIKVGTVEEFQGDERLIIIVTTVRSQSDFLEIDRNFHIGFLDNPKRFNVAVTRARSLLIVVGNPRILKKDGTWNRFLGYCNEHGGCKGVSYEDTENEVDDMLQRFSVLGLDENK